ncbi:hypothetical protein F0L68_26025 [Solihabitans fulvus]|uniref:Uncharacterized protein n=1 Tax=Solihabitans fulvus TaxID=1892852 RepID=A0A5B2X120_9PSEU|nr:hypothetical protein [Solihabitans fulvus]KAA2256716.1 hypothetical protein F0L68_26025 [Solihabitans fulvus]
MRLRAALPLGALLFAATAVGCSAGHSTTSASTQPKTQAQQPAGNSGLVAGDKAFPMPKPGACKVGDKNGQPMPDPTCTPGAINPDVTQANINDTICKSGWTKTVRPATSVTSKMKAESARSYNLADDEKSEYDHLVSLELGGAPDDPRNLWPEPGTVPNPKDTKAENPLHDLVCARVLHGGNTPYLPLAVAQQLIASDWTTAAAKAQEQLVH